MVEVFSRLNKPLPYDGNVGEYFVKDVGYGGDGHGDGGDSYEGIQCLQCGEVVFQVIQHEDVD